MGKDSRYDFDEGSTDALGDDDPEPTQSQSQGQDQDATPRGQRHETGDQAPENARRSPSDQDNSLPAGGEAGDLRTNATHHTLPEEFDMNNLPVKQRRSNVKEYRDVDLTVTIQNETMNDIRDAKRKLEDAFEGEVPKTDVYEIVLIAGANDDLSLLDAAHIVGYGID